MHVCQRILPCEVTKCIIIFVYQVFLVPYLFVYHFMLVNFATDGFTEKDFFSYIFSFNNF